MDKKEICLVYIIDDGFVMPTYVSIVSVKNNKEKNQNIKIYIIAICLSIGEKKLFMSLNEDGTCIKLVNILHNNSKDIVERNCCNPDIHVTPTSLIKFDIPNIVKEDKVIYLDGDTLVQGSLEELYNWDIKEAYLGAVDDIVLEKGNTFSKLGQKIGLKTKHYFNSGVMLLNLSRMREKNISNALLEYRTNGINYFMDQDAFNYICGSERVLLPIRFNFMSTLMDYYSTEEISEICYGNENATLMDCINGSTVLHLTGKMKPWHYYIPVFTDIFLKYYSSSVFHDTPLQLQSVTKYLLEQAKAKEQENIRTKAWRFPYKKVKKDSRIILYGAGQVGKDYVGQLKENSYCKVILWVDKNHKNLGCEVSAPEEISKVEADYIVVAISQQMLAEQIRDGLIKEYPQYRSNIILATEAFL